MAKPITRGESVFLQLREDILAGRLEPGSRLRFEVICRSYGTSVGVVREALSRLAAQGLVQSEPQQGFRVAPISVKDLLDLTDARCEIEGLVLRHAVEQGDLEWESRVVAAHHSLERTPTRIGDDPGVFNEDYPKVHKEFHRMLLVGCANSRLLDIALSLRDAAEMYRRSADRPVGYSHRDGAGEHLRILEATLARDADAAVEALTVHIRNTTDYLLQDPNALFQGSDQAD